MDERRVHLRLTWNRVAKLAGLTKEGLRSVRAETRRMMPLTKRGIEDALRWGTGSIDLILASKPPIELDDSGMLAGPAAHKASEARPGVQRWFVAELERRDQTLDDLRAFLNSLRVIADHNAQTLAEMLLEAGLVDRRELMVRDQPDREKDAIAFFRSEVDEITASPHLSRRQRREIEDLASKELQRIREEKSGDA